MFTGCDSFQKNEDADATHLKHHVNWVWINNEQAFMYAK